jgi:hypothetical protein
MLQVAISRTIPFNSHRPAPTLTSVRAVCWSLSLRSLVSLRWVTLALTTVTSAHESCKCFYCSEYTLLHAEIFTCPEYPSEETGTFWRQVSKEWARVETYLKITDSLSVCVCVCVCVCACARAQRFRYRLRVSCLQLTLATGLTKHLTRIRDVSGINSYREPTM